MDVEKLEHAGKSVESKLIRIRENIGAPIGEYSVSPVKFIRGRELEERAKNNPGEPIIINGEFYLEYINDNSYNRNKHRREVGDNGKGCFVSGNKVHFYYCETLVHMTNKGRGQRYCETSRVGNMQVIDLSPEEENIETRLAWCKNCIEILRQAGKVSRGWKWRLRRSRVAERADAVKFMRCVKLCYKNKPEARQETKSFFESV